LTFADLIALDDLIGRDLFTCDFIDLAVSDAVAGFPVDLIEADLFSLARGREKLNRT
jgi:hypothetical protein